MIVFILFEVLFFAFLLAADLVSKHYIMPFLEAKGNYILINKVITLTPAYNDGAGFSFLAGKTAALIAITSIGLAVILGLIIFGHIKLDLKNKRARFLMSILIMMFAGGLGNLVDRCAFGYVRDFIDYTIVYTIFKRDFAVCNVADIWLTVGMILVVVFVIFLWKGNMLKTAQIVPDDTNAKTAARLLAKMDEIDAIQQQTSDSMVASDSENSMADDTNYTNNTDGDANIEIESQNYTNSIENSDTNKVSGQADAVQDGVEVK